MTDKSIFCFKHEVQVLLTDGVCPDDWCDFDCDADAHGIATNCENPTRKQP